MAKLKPYQGDFYLWEYLPAPEASITFTACFGLATIAVAIRMFRSRTWFSTAFVIGGLFEVVGFGARIIAYQNTEQLVPYAMQSVLILIAPALFAASIYMTLHRLILHLHAEHHSVVSVRWLTKIFVIGDILSFVVQSGGASLSTTVDFDPDIAKWVVFIGLLVQVVIYGLFTVTTIIFHVKIRRRPTEVSLIHKSKWKQTLRMLYMVSVLILIRSAFRIVEYLMGMKTYLFTHEWPLYVFDAELMLLTMAAYAWWYPNHLLQTIYGVTDELNNACLEQTPENGNLAFPINKA